MPPQQTAPKQRTEAPSPYQSNLKGDALAGVPKEVVGSAIETMTKAIQNTAAFGPGIVDQSILAIPEATKLLNEKDPKIRKTVLSFLRTVGEATLDSDGKERKDARNDIKATLVKIITNENEDKEIKDVARKAIIAISKPQEILTLSLLDNKLAIQVYGEDTIKATKEKFKDAPQAEEATYKSSLKGSGLKGLKVESAINTMDATRKALPELSKISPELTKQSISAIPQFTDLLNKKDEAVTKSAILLFEELGKQLLNSNNKEWQDARADLRNTLQTLAANEKENQANRKLAEKALKTISKPNE